MLHLQNPCRHGSRGKSNETGSRKEVIRVMYLPRDEKGQGLVEYALILVLVVIVVVAILTILGPQIGNIFSQITSALTPT